MKNKCLKTLISLTVGCGVTGTVTLFLPSCAFKKPNLYIPGNGQQEWFEHKFQAICNFVGYYKEDVYAKVDVPNEHRNEISHLEQKIQKYPFESLVIDFFLHPVGVLSKPFNITINWYVKHTSIHKTTTEQIIPNDQNNISFIQSFTYNSSILNPSSSQPEFTIGNSFESINGYYNKQPYANGNQYNKQNIYININNDIVYYQHLIFDNLKKICVSKNTPIIGDVDVNLVQESWQMNLSLNYNYDTQTFDYIQFHITADGDSKILGINYNNVATISINYAWGNKKADIDTSFPVLQQFNKNIDKEITYHSFEIPDCKGPKLLGAYSLQNNITPHVGINKDLKPYNQNFLSLVPSDKQSYQLYDVCIYIKNSMFQLFVGKFVDSGFHIYFGRQPRMFGLELITNERAVSTHYYPGGQYSYDSFANLGLVLPSYCLTTAKYNAANNSFDLPVSIPQINQCSANIDTITPSIINETHPSDGQAFCTHFFDTFVSSKTHSYDDTIECEDDTLNAKIGDSDFIYGLIGDKNSMYPIDPYDQNIIYPNGKSEKYFFDTRLEWLEKKTNCIKGNVVGHVWDNINIKYGGNSLATIPWWQTIQVYSRGYELNNPDSNEKCYAGPNNGDDILALNSESNAFTKFIIGLNYMFTPSVVSTEVGADNCFTYTDLNNIQYTNDPNNP